MTCVVMTSPAFMLGEALLVQVYYKMLQNTDQLSGPPSLTSELSREQQKELSVWTMVRKTLERKGMCVFLHWTNSLVLAITSCIYTRLFRTIIWGIASHVFFFLSSVIVQRWGRSQAQDTELSKITYFTRKETTIKFHAGKTHHDTAVQ
jgi:hypothetical protein